MTPPVVAVPITIVGAARVVEEIVNGARTVAFAQAAFARAALA